MPSTKVESTRVRNQSQTKDAVLEREAEREEGCVFLGIEPSGKIAFCQIGDREQDADEQVTEAMLEQYPNLAYVAIVPASIQAVRADAVRLNRPR